MLLSAVLLVVLPNGATAQDETTGNVNINDSFNTTIDVNSQTCQVIIEQYNQAVAGDAIASGDGAIAETAATVNAPIDVVQDCVQAGEDANLVGGDSPEENANGEGPGDVAANNSIDGSFNENVQIQEQNCTVIVEQYNNAIAGDAIASGDAAIAAVAAEVNAPIEVVQKCLQVGGDVQKEDTDRNTADDDGNAVAALQAGVLRTTIPQGKLPNTGGGTTVGVFSGVPASAVLIPAGAFLVASGLGTALLIRRSPGGRG